MPSRKMLSRSILLALLTMLAIVWLIPLAITFLTALKSNEEFASTAMWSLPKDLSLIHI